jgi:hypothetical protein
LIGQETSALRHEVSYKELDGSKLKAQGAWPKAEKVHRERRKGKREKKSTEQMSHAETAVTAERIVGDWGHP